MTYRVFIGGWDSDDTPPDWVSFVAGGLTWEEAKALLHKKLSAYNDDTCEPCREMAAEELKRLQTAEPDRFEGTVDGNDYMILRESPLIKGE